MSNLQYGIPALAALSPTAIPHPSSLVPEAKNPRALLTTLRAHQHMLTTLYVTQNNAYVSAYTVFETQCAAAGGTTSMGVHDVVAKPLGQQKEIMLFQTFLWNFEVFVDGLENEVGDLEEEICA